MHMHDSTTQHHNTLYKVNYFHVETKLDNSCSVIGYILEIVEF